MAIGNDKTTKLGNLRIKTFNAIFKGKSNSTIFLTRSNITPTDTETTVKAEIANINGGTSCPNNHLSIIGIFLKIFGKILIIYLDIILINVIYSDIHEKDNFYLNKLFIIINLIWKD